MAILKYFFILLSKGKRAPNKNIYVFRHQRFKLKKLIN